MKLLYVDHSGSHSNIAIEMFFLNEILTTTSCLLGCSLEMMVYDFWPWNLWRLQFCSLLQSPRILRLSSSLLTVNYTFIPALSCSLLFMLMLVYKYFDACSIVSWWMTMVMLVHKQKSTWAGFQIQLTMNHIPSTISRYCVHCWISVCVEVSWEQQYDPYVVCSTTCCIHLSGGSRLKLLGWLVRYIWRNSHDMDSWWTSGFGCKPIGTGSLWESWTAIEPVTDFRSAISFLCGCVCNYKQVTAIHYPLPKYPSTLETVGLSMLKYLKLFARLSIQQVFWYLQIFWCFGKCVCIRFVHKSGDEMRCLYWDCRRSQPCLWCSLIGISERRPYLSETILPVLSALVPSSEPVLGSRTKDIVQEWKGVSLNILASKQPDALPVSILLISSFHDSIRSALFYWKSSGAKKFLAAMYVTSW